MWGVSPDDFAEEVVEVWPDCWDAVQFFAEVPPAAWLFKPDTSGQNASGERVTYPGGPVGIRPEAFRELRLSLGVTGVKWREIYPDVRALEQAAVETMRAQR